ncbi:MAG TPA: four helix bundle protein [Candidatus Kapabacteria bacterium]|nr:four helix bundle protein [Candidatus Kapabacteria bacterium]
MNKRTDTFENLEVWKAAMELVQEIYGITEHFPESETAVLLHQIRTAAIKIPAKIAAGHSCGRDGMAFRFFAYTLATIGMLETHLELSVRFKYVPKLEANPVFEKCKKISRMVEKMVMPEDE